MARRIISNRFYICNKYIHLNVFKNLIMPMTLELFEKLNKIWSEESKDILY